MPSQKPWPKVEYESLELQEHNVTGERKRAGLMIEEGIVKLGNENFTP